MVWVTVTSTRWRKSRNLSETGAHQYSAFAPMFAEEVLERVLVVLSLPTAEMKNTWDFTFTVYSSVWFGAEA